MGRNSIIAGMALALTAAATLVVRSPEVALGAQDTTADEPMETALLRQGERFRHPSWSLEIQDSFTVASGDRTGYDEVRIAVALQNRTDADLPFQWTAFTGQPGYPILRLRDAAGNLHPLNLTEPLSASVPTSTLVAQPSNIPARWTIGYEIPSAFADELEVVAFWEGRPVASWRLEPDVRPIYQGWSAPPSATVVRWGDDLAWEGDLLVTPLADDLQVCGDSSTEYAVAVYGLAVRVTNSGTSDALWPNVRYPDDVGIAVWADGGSARTGGAVVAETFVAEDGRPAADPLDARNREQVLVPPGFTAIRMLTFALPRDGRFGSAFLLPQAVTLYPPDGGSVWLDRTGTELVDFSLSSDVCVEFAPSAPFDVVPAS